MQIRICDKCGKKNPANRFTCVTCGTDISLLPIKIEDEKLTNTNIRYFKICPVCNHEVDIKNEKEKIRQCPYCGNDAIKRLTEDSVQKQEINKEQKINNTENKETDLNLNKAGISALRLINQRDGRDILIPNGKHMIGAYGDIEPEYFWNLNYVSGQHAVIEVTNTEVYVMDNNSRNFTYINGNRIFPNNRNILVDGDILTLADQKFEVSICR